MPLVTVTNFMEPRRPDTRYYDGSVACFWEATPGGSELHLLSRGLLRAATVHPHLTRCAYPITDDSNPSFKAPWGQDTDDRAGKPGLHEPHMDIMRPWFTPDVLQRMTLDFERYATELIHEIVDRGTGRVDLATEFAGRFALRCAGRLVGADLPEAVWRPIITEHVSAPFENVPRQREIDDAVWALIDARRADPSGERCMLDSVIEAFDGGTLDAEYVPGLVWMVIIATESTTAANIVSMIGLLDDAGKIAEAAASLDRHRVITNIVEAALKYGQVFDSTPPLRAVCDTTIGEINVPKDTIVWAWYVSANRNIKGGNKFDITRPSNHVAFSTPNDPHRCIGASMARVMMAIALRRLLPGLPSLRRDPEGTVLQYVGLNNAYVAAPFLFDRTAAQQAI